MTIFSFALALLISAHAYSSDDTEFFAYYTKIEAGEEWENNSRTAKHADLVVKVNDGEIVFHRSSSYLPCWKTSTGTWYFDEIIPRNGDGTDLRPDKNNIYSFLLYDSLKAQTNQSPYTGVISRIFNSTITLNQLVEMLNSTVWSMNISPSTRMDQS